MWSVNSMVDNMRRLTLHQLLPLLRFKEATPTPEEAAIRQRFLERHPDQAANIASYQARPVCKCANELMKAMGQDHNVLVEKMTYILGEPIEIVVPRSVAGQVFEIDDTQSDWANFIAGIQKEMCMFRGMNIVPFGPKLKIYFY